MEKVKKVLDRIFIEGLSAMAHGLFATLIIGTIIQQIGTFMGGNIGEMIFIAGKLAASLTGAGIGVAVAYKFKEAPLVVVSAATAGMAGAFASSILAGKVFVDGAMVFAGPGEPLHCRLCGNLLRTYGIRKDEGRYPGDSGCDDWKWMSGRIPDRTTDLGIHELAWFTDQLGNRTAAVPDGNYRICTDGNDPDTADQFSSTWCNPESVRSGSRCGNGWMLL